MMRAGCLIQVEVTADGRGFSRIDVDEKRVRVHPWDFLTGSNANTLIAMPCVIVFGCPRLRKMR